LFGFVVDELKDALMDAFRLLTDNLSSIFTTITAGFMKGIGHLLVAVGKFVDAPLLEETGRELLEAAGEGETAHREAQERREASSTGRAHEAAARQGGWDQSASGAWISRHPTTGTWKTNWWQRSDGEWVRYYAHEGQNGRIQHESEVPRDQRPSNANPDGDPQASLGAAARNLAAAANGMNTNPDGSVVSVA